MTQPAYQISDKLNPPIEVDWTASNSAAGVVALPYVGRPLPWPPPTSVSRDLPAANLSEEVESDDTLLQQVLAQFSAELRFPMSEEVVARIEEETPEVPAQYDLATYEYEYEKPDRDPV